MFKTNFKKISFSLCVINCRSRRAGCSICNNCDFNESPSEYLCVFRKQYSVVINYITFLESNLHNIFFSSIETHAPFGQVSPVLDNKQIEYEIKSGRLLQPL